MITLPEPIEFLWDKGNIDKNLVHGVSNEEVEEIFFDQEKRIGPDLKHSTREQRQIVIGRTKTKRWLYVVITIRDNEIRVISARYMHKKEVKLYEEAFENTKI